MAVAKPGIRSGAFHAYFLYDVADTIDLAKVAAIKGGSAQRAPLQRGSAQSPSRIQFAVPPLASQMPPTTVRGHSVAVRVKIYDYGVISVRLSAAFSGSWDEYAALATALRTDDEAGAHAQAILRSVLQSCADALDDQHEPLVEDYYLYAVQAFEPPIDAASLLGELGGDLARLITAESRPLSDEEQRELLRVRFSYLPDDLTVVLWDSGFVYEGAEDASMIEDILEFANSQLVEYRTYDARLDAELDAIYAIETPRQQPHRWLQRRAADARAAQLRYLFVDVRELSDRATNALKIIGDAYYARIYRAIAMRLGLDDWQRQVDSKLGSVGELYRFLIDQAETARSEFLEIIVILLIAIEIVVGILGLRR